MRFEITIPDRLLPSRRRCFLRGWLSGYSHYVKHAQPFRSASGREAWVEGWREGKLARVQEQPR